MSCHINKLPNELLRNIFQRLRNGYTPSELKEVLSCLTCCRHWQRIAEPVLRTDIVLSNSNISSFISNTTPENALFVYSLTIRITPIVVASEPRSCVSAIGVEPELMEEMMKDDGTIPYQNHWETRILWQSLHNLTASVVEMTHLTTFSLVVVPTKLMSSGFWLRRKELSKLICSLPESCINVELDTCGYDRVTTGSEDLCKTLRGIMPRLEHLRLSLAMLCDSLFLVERPSTLAPSSQYEQSFHVSAPRLHTLTIALFCGKPEPSAVLCSPSLNDSFALTMGIWPAPVPAFYKIISTAKAAYVAGSFPNAIKIAIFDHVSRHDQGDEFEYETLNERNIITNQTQRMPYKSVSQEPRSILLRCKDRKGDDREVYGDFREVYQIAEGPVFLTTFTNSRFPASFASAPAIADAGYLLKDVHTDVDDREAFHASHRFSSILWVRERLAGKTLLGVKVEEGLDGTESVREDEAGTWRA
ncbi:hypothetical protein MMC12_005043 [Toensbergia leucococca]|nr:hypothetical protein [Toensbergia leucococca]